MTLTLGVGIVSLLALVVAGEARPAARLSNVTVTSGADTVTVHLRTSSVPKYHTQFADGSARIVVDLQHTVYGWRKTPLRVKNDPVTQVSGRQQKKGLTRVVVDLTNRVDYAVREDADGLAIVVSRAAPVESEMVAAAAAQTTDAPRRATRATAPPKTVKVDFKDVELPVFIRLVSDVTGKNFIFDERVTGRVTVITPKEVSVDGLYQLLLEILQFKGYAAVQTNGLIQIVPLSEAKQNWTEVTSNPKLTEGFVTRLVPLSYLNANEGLRILTPLVSRNGVLSADLQTNTVILTDNARNVERLVAVLTALDKEAPRSKAEINVYVLQNADAEEVARSLTALAARPAPVPGQTTAVRGTLAGPVTVTADKTRNALLIVATPEDYAALKDVIVKLDVKRRQEGKINVYPLEYAEAEDLAKTLTTLFARQLTAPAAAPGGLLASLSVPLTGPVTITSDKARNSLVVVAAPEDYDALKEVIRQLDLRRRQVYVEAAIIEITDTKLKQLGVEFQLGGSVPGSSTATAVASTNLSNGLATAQTSGLAAISGLAAGVIKGTIKFNGMEFLNVLAFVRALQSETGVNVLSTPHLLTTDNQKAEIVVGENVPFVSGQSQTSGGNVLTTVERRDVGITLRLTPRVTEGNFVKLDIYQEISALTTEPGFDPTKTGPVISKRFATTTVVAKDSETIAIGGLVKDNTNRIRSQVPLLGDIPILGWLFRYYNRQDEKTNVLIFITPTIVKDTTLGEMTEKKRKEMEKSREQLDGRDKKSDGHR